MAFWIFFLCSPDCPKQPKIEYPFYRFLYPMICDTISGVLDESLLWNPHFLRKKERKFSAKNVTLAKVPYLPNKVSTVAL